MDSYGEISFQNSVDCLALDVGLEDKTNGQCENEVFTSGTVPLSLQSNAQPVNSTVTFNVIQSEEDYDNAIDEQEVKIEDIAVSQEVVEVSVDPSLLLFVKNNPKKIQQFSKQPNIEPVKVSTLTKALREVKKVRDKPLIPNQQVVVNNGQSVQEIEGDKIYEVLLSNRPHNIENPLQFTSEITNKIFSTEVIDSSKSNCASSLNYNNIRTAKVKNDEQFECGDCGRRFREKSHLATHSRAHVDIRNFKCEVCSLRFKTKSNLYYHSQTHSDSPFTCTDCSKTFPERKMLKRHLRVVHSQAERHTCDQCNRSFKSSANLSLHYSIHTGSKPFQCSLCPKSFVYKSTLAGHLRAHEAEQKFNCTLCPDRKSCSHQSGARPWLCTVCGKGYPLKGSLKAHMKIHDPEKPFKCKECPKSFMKKQSYESHIAMHNGEGPQFMCDQCSQSYFNVFALKRHYLKHTSARGFVCEICSKAFWMKDALKVHLRSHQSIKGFPCSKCPKAFTHKHSLEAHLKTHQQDNINHIEYQKTILQIL